MAFYEFRTPLTTIAARTSIVENLLNLDRVEDTPKHLKLIKASVERITSMLDDFLAIDRLEESKTECQKSEFNIHEVIKDCVEELRFLESPGQFVDYIHEGDTNITEDKPMLQNVLSNLASNALKYSNKTVTIRSYTSDNNLKISIKDQGCGIPEQDQKNI